MLQTTFKDEDMDGHKMAIFLRAHIERSKLFSLRFGEREDVDVTRDLAGKPST